MNQQKLPYISLGIVGLMLILPFLYWYHQYPITSFYQEMIAAILGLLAVSYLAVENRAIEVPSLAAIPLGLMAVAIAQYSFGLIGHLDQVMMLSAYMTFAVLIMALGRRLRAELGIKEVVTWIAIALVIGTEISAVIGMLQHFNYSEIGSELIIGKVGSYVYGNIAQPNQFADYIALGLVSLWLLWARFSMPIWSVVLMATPMLYVLALSRSRGALLYLAVIALVVFKPSWKSIKYLVAFILFGAGLIAAFHFDSLISESIRLHVWRNALMIFLDHPIIGAGFGQFAYQNMMLASLHDKVIAEMFCHSHNLLLQVAAEMGMIGAIVLCVPLLLFVKREMKLQATNYHIWGYACLAIIGIHSLVEYPLWYLYLIGIAALIFGILDEQAFKINYAAGILLISLSFVSAMRIYADYKHIELIGAYREAATKDTRYFPKMQGEIIEVSKSPFLSSYAELFSAEIVVPNKELLQEKIALSDRAIGFIPIPAVTYHRAFLLAINGKQKEAEEQIDRAIWMYPSSYIQAKNEMKNMQRLKGMKNLLEYADNVYSGYKSK